MNVDRALAVVTVTHNTKDITLGLLQSLHSDPDSSQWDVVIIDNESTDGTEAAIREQHPWVRVVRNQPQRGFAAGANQGIGMTTAPVVVILGPDVRPPVGALRRLRTILEASTEVAAVGPRILNPDRSFQRNGMFRPTPYTAFVTLANLARVPPFSREANRYYGAHLTGPPTQVEQLTAACLVMRRSAFEAVGPFDERFFVYCEDVDWCLRATDAGFRLMFVPAIEVVHEKAVTSRTNSAWVIRAYYRSLRLYYAKHHSTRSSLAARLFWTGGAYLKETAALAVNAVRSTKGLRY